MSIEKLKQRLIADTYKHGHCSLTEVKHQIADIVQSMENASLAAIELYTAVENISGKPSKKHVTLFIYNPDAIKTISHAVGRSAEVRQRKMTELQENGWTLLDLPPHRQKVTGYRIKQPGEDKLH